MDEQNRNKKPVLNPVRLSVKSRTTCPKASTLSPDFYVNSPRVMISSFFSSFRISNRIRNEDRHKPWVPLSGCKPHASNQSLEYAADIPSGFLILFFSLSFPTQCRIWPPKRFNDTEIADIKRMRTRPDKHPDDNNAAPATRSSLQMPHLGDSMSSSPVELKSEIQKCQKLGRRQVQTQASKRGISRHLLYAKGKKRRDRERGESQNNIKARAFVTQSTQTCCSHPKTRTPPMKNPTVSFRRRLNEIQAQRVEKRTASS